MALAIGLISVNTVYAQETLADTIQASVLTR